MSLTKQQITYLQQWMGVNGAGSNDEIFSCDGVWGAKSKKAFFDRTGFNLEDTNALLTTQIAQGCIEFYTGFDTRKVRWKNDILTANEAKDYGAFVRNCDILMNFICDMANTNFQMAWFLYNLSGESHSSYYYYFSQFLDKNLINSTGTWVSQNTTLGCLYSHIEKVWERKKIDKSGKMDYGVCSRMAQLVGIRGVFTPTWEDFDQEHLNPPRAYLGARGYKNYFYTAALDTVPMHGIGMVGRPFYDWLPYMAECIYRHHLILRKEWGEFKKNEMKNWFYDSRFWYDAQGNKRGDTPTNGSGTQVEPDAQGNIPVPTDGTGNNFGSALSNGINQLGQAASGLTNGLIPAPGQYAQGFAQNLSNIASDFSEIVLIGVAGYVCLQMVSRNRNN